MNNMEFKDHYKEFTGRNLRKENDEVKPLTIMTSWHTDITIDVATQLAVYAAEDLQEKQ